MKNVRKTHISLSKKRSFLTLLQQIYSKEKHIAFATKKRLLQAFLQFKSFCTY